MGNLVRWIKEVAGEEKIEGVVIGRIGWDDYGKESVPNYDDIPKGKLLTWEEAQKWLNFDFNDGYGAPMCPAIYAWTETKIVSINQYDGATWPHSIPRHPVDVMPTMEGG